MSNQLSRRPHESGSGTTVDAHVGAERENSGFGSPRYRNYVLTALLFVYILNFVDRGLLSVVAPQMIAELGISDTSFGLLTGFGFALLYTIVGIPLAQIAETRHRVWIIAICLALWSTMTALCGLASEITIGSITIGAFWVLLICRFGVGIGEAGCTPPANSLIADYFAPRFRSTALGYYAMGVTLGTFLANAVGGPIADIFGWRAAFFILGAPGVLVAILLKLTVREPPRGYSDAQGTVRHERPRFLDGIRKLSSKRSYWAMTAGATIAAFCGYGLASFQSLFLNRTFGMSVSEAAVLVNAPVAVASAIGTVFTGWLAGKIATRHPNAIAWLPGTGLLLATPIYMIAFTTDSLWICLASLCAGGAIKYGYLAAQYTIGQGVVSSQFRAVSTAILLFVVNLLGYGLGPLFIGFLSDQLFAHALAELSSVAIAVDACKGSTALALSQADQLVCDLARSESLQMAMLVTACFYALSGICFLLTCRWLRSDMAAQ